MGKSTKEKEVVPLGLQTPDMKETQGLLDKEVWIPLNWFPYLIESHQRRTLAGTPQGLKALKADPKTVSDTGWKDPQRWGDNRFLRAQRVFG
ncbi:Hypothetical protein NTJ_07069 [Nesidiocoris tenuis]|uniref:Uncharacterized protein n=1 Tax=Nesidiocoris tenuis TaxID=355587 RepID=A0ABN7ATK1_9HEMI|nr:Hypothetical protein NTJ_07069 [Nesidiocoris tenuis]